MFLLFVYGFSLPVFSIILAIKFKRAFCYSKIIKSVFMCIFYKQVIIRNVSFLLASLSRLFFFSLKCKRLTTGA